MTVFNELFCKTFKFQGKKRKTLVENKSEN